MLSTKEVKSFDWEFFSTDGFCWVWLKESLSYGLSWVKAAPHLPKNIFSVQAVAKRGAVMVSKLKIVLVPFFKHHTQLVVILAP